MIVKRMRLGRTGVLLASLALVASGCGDQSSGSSSPAESAPDDTAATESGSRVGETLGDHEGLCSWASPEDLEKIFGEPADALGGKECRIVPADEDGSGGFYHLRLDQDAGFDELTQRLVDNQEGLGFTICGDESSRWQGLRVSRRVICPSGGGEVDDFQPLVSVEVGPGRVLTNQPFPTDSEEAAQEASQRFVAIMKAFAAGGAAQPVVNEVLPGTWLEVHNPGTQPIDLSGATVTGYDDFDDALTGTMQVPDGATVAPGGRLVIDIAGLEGTTGDTPLIELAAADGQFIDLVDLSMVEAGEVVRRGGDGGPFCSFGSAEITRGAPNPAACD